MDFDKMSEMLSQATAMRESMEERMNTLIVEGSAGGGAVGVRMNGRKELLKVTAAAGDITLLEDLIVAAINDAGRKADNAVQASSGDLLGSLGLPDF